MNNNIANIKPLSDAISSPITSAYKMGGLGLTFLTLGTILILVAFFWNDRSVLTYSVFSVGIMLIVVTLVYFYFKELRKLFVVRESINENKELIDTIQQAALEMTELAYSLQSLIFKHADDVASTIQFIRPIIKDLPLVGDIADSDAMIKTEELSANIVATTEKVKNVIEDLEEALVESDPQKLKKYLSQVKEYKADVKDLLGKGN